MTTKKSAPKEPVYTINNCSITNTNAPTNEHTRDAIVALANALEANANALAETARALKGGDVTMENGFRLGT